MATFIDEDENTSQATEDEEFDTLDTGPEDSVKDQTTDSSDEEDEDNIPEKYKNKSVKDIVRMHQEAEKAMGKQGSEVGELRRVVDDYIRAQTITQQAPKVEEEDIDFYDDPNAAVARAIERHPKVKQAEELASRMKKAEALNNLKAQHPDFSETIQDSSFQEWVMKSKVRQELYARADQRFDFDAASELLSTWQERRSVVQQTADVEKASRKQAIKAASTGSSKGTGEGSKKTYRRSDIIELMRRDPDRYQALSDEIMKAYAEGRVK
tara:strand:+ start:5406 stop:6209 length:804 start_codon:yes stop_codon:yes gene_type:complete